MDVLKNGEILLHGIVGEGFFEDGFTAMDVVSALAEIGRGEDVDVHINSGGGIATEGVAIFNSLDSHRGNVTVIVEAVATSAASLIALAGDEIIMKTGALLMVHDPAAFTMGNKADHQKSVEMLDTLSASMADIYAEKTGRPIDEIRAEMAEETWLTADEAVEKGYADRTGERRNEQPTAFDYRIYQHAPERMVALAVANAWEMNAGAPASPKALPTPSAMPPPTPGIDVEAVYANLNQGRGNAMRAVTVPEPMPPTNFLSDADTRRVWDNVNGIS